jgi:hypothetical protein
MTEVSWEQPGRSSSTRLSRSPSWLRNTVVYATSFLIVAFLYARFFLPNIEGGSTLILLAALAMLIMHVVLEIIQPSSASVAFSPEGKLSLIFIGIASIGGVVSSYLRYQELGFLFRDMATLFFVSLSPFLLLFTSRKLLVTTICQVAIFFSLADAVANTLSYLGLYELVTYSGRVDESGLRLRYPGLSGSTLGSGLVAFLAVSYLTKRAMDEKHYRSLIFVLIGFIIFSMVLIDARRYLGVALVAVILIAWPKRFPIRPIFVIFGIAAVFLFLTFKADALDTANYLRSSLMSYGWSTAFDNVFIGLGVYYLDYEGAVATFESLAFMGVVESQFIEILRDFGVVPAFFWISGILLIAFRRNGLSTLPGILFALLAAEVAYGSPLRGPLGSIIFYACYLILMEVEPKKGRGLATYQRDPLVGLRVPNG